MLRTAYRKQFYPNQWYRWKAETLKVCLLLYIVWRVCDQAFGRHRPLKGAESGHVTITKIEISTQTDVEEFTDSKNVIHFDL